MAHQNVFRTRERGGSKTSCNPKPTDQYAARDPGAHNGNEHNLPARRAIGYRLCTRTRTVPPARTRRRARTARYGEQGHQAEEDAELKPRRASPWWAI